MGAVGMGELVAEKFTRLLDDARQGSEPAARELLPLVYDQLRQLARQQMALERKGHTLEATALVHEAYLRLRFCAGMSVAETAKVMGLSQRTVEREWACARAWLFRKLGYE